MCLPQEIFWEEWLSWWEAAAFTEGCWGGGGQGQGRGELQKHSMKYPLKWGEGNRRQFLDPRSLAYVALVLHSYSIV